MRQSGIVVLGMLGGSTGRKHPKEVATAQAVATKGRARKLAILVARDVSRNPLRGWLAWFGRIRHVLWRGEGRRGLV